MTAAILANTRARWAATITHDAPAAARLWHDLEARLVGEHGTTGQRGAPGPRYPNSEAIGARTLIRHTLASWCRLIAEERLVGLPADEVGAMGGYLVVHAAWLAEQDYGDECAGEIHELATGWAWRVCYPTGTRIVPIGRCPQTGCAGTVRAVLRPAEAPLDSELACDTCRCTWPTHRWHAYPGRAA